MKKIILFTSLLSLLIVHSFAQEITSKKNPSNDDGLFAKSKKQKTWGWVCLGGGSLLLLIGIASYPRDYNLFFNSSPDTRAKGDAAIIVSGIGTLSMIGSIPLFIAAGKNKFKARVLLSSQKTTLYIPNKLGSKITGLTISIPL